MLDAALPAADVPLETGTHYAPANAGSVAHGNIRIRHAEDPLLHEVEHFLVKRRLETIGHMARKRLVQTHRLLADTRVERHRALDRGFRGLGSAHNLHQGNDMRRVERVTHDTALRALST